MARDDTYPDPVGDPEADGLPGVADDDSSADSGSHDSRAADGSDPVALPADRPIAVFDFGTTGAEEAAGEPLDARLGREVPDVGDLDPPTGGAPDDDPAPDPHLDSEVSSYDRPDDADGGPVGRLVEPDEGVREDVDAELIAGDVGSAGGGASAEEAAMHRTREW